ncbi:MAG: hypothetical protein AVDCRST_MAG54-81, partial [uncultured Actinomycetospora sp.]
ALPLVPPRAARGRGRRGRRHRPAGDRRDGRGRAGGVVGHLGPPRDVREHPELGRRHRERVQGRAAVHRLDVGGVRRRAVRLVPRRGLPHRADRRGPQGAGGAGLERLADLLGGAGPAV